jgi:hypothetical protein
MFTEKRRPIVPAEPGWVREVGDDLDAKHPHIDPPGVSIQSAGAAHSLNPNGYRDARLRP